MISIAGTGGGKGTFDAVMHGLRLLQRHNVEYNVLACVGRETAKHPLEIYRFLRDEGVEFIQFTPVVERRPGASSTTGMSTRAITASTPPVQAGQYSHRFTARHDRQIIALLAGRCKRDRPAPLLPGMRGAGSVPGRKLQ